MKKNNYTLCMYANDDELRKGIIRERCFFFVSSKHAPFRRNFDNLVVGVSLASVVSYWEPAPKIYIFI